jgi:uncharacterized HAD superfamily protein
MNFIERCVLGEIEDPIKEISDYIDFWHDKDKTDIPLRSYLGMTEEEYGKYITKGDIYILYIIEVRKNEKLQKELSDLKHEAFALKD